MSCPFLYETSEEKSKKNTTREGKRGRDREEKEEGKERKKEIIAKWVEVGKKRREKSHQEFSHLIERAREGP